MVPKANAPFVKDFKVADTSATDSDALAYANIGRNLTAQQAAEIKKRGVPASALSAGSAGRVTIEGKDLSFSQYDEIKVAYDAMQARLQRERQEQALKNARSSAVSDLENQLKKTSDNKPQITDAQLKTQFNTDNPSDTIADSKS